MPVSYLLSFTILMLSSYHFLVETSRATSHTSEEHTKAFMRSKANEDSRNTQDQQKRDGAQGYPYRIGLNKNDISLNNDMDIRFQDTSKDNKYRHYNQDGAHLFKYISTLRSNAVTQKASVSPLHDSSYKHLSTKRSSEDTYPDQKLTSRSLPFSAEKLRNAESSFVTNSRSKSHLTSNDSRMSKAVSRSNTLRERGQNVQRSITSNLIPLTKQQNRPKGVSQVSDRHTDSARTRHNEVPDTSMSPNSFVNVSDLDNRTSGNVTVNNAQPQRNISGLTSFPDGIDYSESNTKSPSKTTDNVTMSFLEHDSKNINISMVSTSSPLAPLQPSSNVRRQRLDDASNLNSKKYGHDREKIKRKHDKNTKTGAPNSGLGKFEPQASSNDHRQNNSLEVDEISSRGMKNVPKGKVHQKNVDKETDEELNVEQKQDGQEIEDDVSDEKSGNEACPTCRKSGLTEENVRQMHKEMFKDLLIKKLRINQHAMRMDGVQSDGKIENQLPKLPPSIVEQTMKDNAEELEKDQFYARDEEIIIAAKDMEKDCVKDHVTGCYSFTLKDTIKFPVAEARLWFYQIKDMNDPHGQVFNVSELEKTKSNTLNLGKTIAVENATVSNDGWFNVNVTDSLLTWLDMRNDIQMLAIRCSTCGSKHGYKPLLVIKYAMSGHVVRNRRSESCDPRYSCCKRDLVVNFHELNMVEIYEPRNLSIGFCYGECNGMHQYPFNHTDLTQQVRVSNVLDNNSAMRDQLRPCCVPLVLKDTFIMTIERNEYIRKIVPKVIVETCGCM